MHTLSDQAEEVMLCLDQLPALETVAWAGRLSEACSIPLQRSDQVGHLPEGVSPERSQLMGRVRQKGTSAEMAVRRALHSIGARFRVNATGLPGRPDIANRSKGKAIFVHGCFWHQHPECPKATMPKKNRAFWKEKFDANKQRDFQKQQQLINQGFEVLTIWECEIASDSLTTRLRYFWYGANGCADIRP